MSTVTLGMMNIGNWSLLVLLSLLWGGSFFFTEIALVETSPLLTVWARVAGAALIFLILLKLKGVRLPRDPMIWFAFFIMGLLNNAIPFCLIVWGQTEINSSLASIFNATTPLFTILLAQFLTDDEKITLGKAAGLLLGFLGVMIMIGLDAINGMGGSVYAQIAILCAAISYGLAAIWGRRFKGLSPMVVACGQVICSSLTLTPALYFWGFPDGFCHPSSSVIFALFGLALFCTVFGYLLYFKILATSGATNLMLVTFLIPISAMTLGIVFLNESLSLDQFIGMVLILFGLLIIDGRLFKIIRLRD